MPKNGSKRNVIKENYHSNLILNYLWLDLQNFLMEFYQVYEKSCPQHGSQFFIYVKRPSIFVERTYQLKNFDMNVKGFHLGCPLLSTKSIYFYEIYNTISSSV